MPLKDDSKWQAMQQSYRINLLQKNEQLKRFWHQYISNNNLQARIEVKRLSHQLTGSGAIYGYQDITNTARQLMDLLFLPFKDELTQRISEHNAYIDLQESLQEACQSNNQQTISPDTKQAAEHAEQKICLITKDNQTSEHLTLGMHETGFQLISLQDESNYAHSIQHEQPVAIIYDMLLHYDLGSSIETMLPDCHQPGKRLPVIFIATEDNFESRLAATRGGCSHFMHKPLDIPLLLNNLRKLLNVSQDDPYRILLVDDDADVLRFYRHALGMGGYKVQTATKAKQAFDLLYKFEPELVIIDINMPDCSGLELGQIIRQNPELADTPLMFMSADDHTDEKMAAVNLAGDDFIQKPIPPWRLLMTVEARVKRSRLLKQQKRAVIQRPELVQNIDTLTALPTLWQLKRDIAAQLQKQQPFCLLKLDLDQFHLINDVYGRATGDLVLQTIAWQLAQLIKDDDRLYRETSDEFWLLCMHINTLELAAQFTEQMLLRLEHISANFDVNIHFSTSVGLCLISDSNKKVEDIMQHTSTALYEAKKKAGHQFRFYDPEQQDKIDLRMQLTHTIRQAITKRQFSCAYQPILTADKQVASLEILARWQHQELGTISPAQFIPLLEEQGLISYLTQQMLDTGLAQLTIWRKQHPKLQLNVNFSAQDLLDPELCRNLLERMKQHKLPNQCLIVEITESILIQAGSSAIEQLNHIAKQGFCIALDDFGTGYSSLSYLDKFPVSKLKIDRSFVQRVDDSQQDKLLPAIIHLAQDLGLEITAEGVETQTQFNYLKSFGCQCFQGYLFSKPLAAEDIAKTAWFKEKLTS